MPPSHAPGVDGTGSAYMTDETALAGMLKANKALSVLTRLSVFLVLIILIEILSFN
ncbi:MAG: hypothetical protein AAB293_05260 [Pseudomonadota bacterium]